MFAAADQTSMKEEDTSLIHSGEIPSILLKPGPNPQSDETITLDETTNRRATWTVAPAISHNPFDDCPTPALAFIPDTNGTSDMFGEFRDAQECMSDFERDEAQNRQEFADNNLTIPASMSPADQSASSSGSGEEKWWNTAGQVAQNASKLEVTANMSQLTESTNKSASSSMSSQARIPITNYFTMHSAMPDIVRHIESDVKIDDTLIVAPKKTNTTQQKSAGLGSLSKQCSNDESQADRTLCEDKEATSTNTVVIFINF